MPRPIIPAVAKLLFTPVTVNFDLMTFTYEDYLDRAKVNKHTK